MDVTVLKSTAKDMVANGKGILAADESSKTIQKRFDKIGLESNPDTNLAYRKILFTTSGIQNYISGVILFDETIRQTIEGKSVCGYLQNKGIIPGIKTDKGAIDLPNFPGEKITEGLDGLSKRDEEYDLETCKQVTIKNLKAVFERHAAHKVALEGLILKTNMVTCGEDNPNQATPQEVAKATIEAYLESVPKELPAIVFLSGGQSPDMATDNLSALCKSKSPWPFTFSFSRALQGEAMEIWAGKDENAEVAQKTFLERAKKVSDARSKKPAF